MNGMFLTSRWCGLSKGRRSFSAPQLRPTTDGRLQMDDASSAGPEQGRTFLRQFLLIVVVLVLVFPAPRDRRRRIL